MTSFLAKRPYHLLILTAVMMLIAIFTREDYVADLHLHDTYIVVSARLLTWLMIGVLLLIWLVYMAAHRTLYAKKVNVDT